MPSGAAVEWMSRARHGYCDRTSSSGNAGCSTRARGGWDLTDDEARTWLGAVRACLDKCGGCANCRFISVSQRWKDCGWHRDCKLNSLKQDVPQFLTGAVGVAARENRTRGEQVVLDGFLQAARRPLAPRGLTSRVCDVKPATATATVRSFSDSARLPPNLPPFNSRFAAIRAAHFSRRADRPALSRLLQWAPGSISRPSRMRFTERRAAVAWQHCRGWAAQDPPRMRLTRG